MEHRAVRDKYRAWCDGRLSAGQRRRVRDHLDACAECRIYYERMNLLIEDTDPALLPRLVPDPFLPARIRALAGAQRARRLRARAVASLRFAAAGLVLLAAATAGVHLGRELSTRSGASSAERGTDLAGAYYEAFSPSDFSGVWENVLEEAENGEKSEVER